MYLEIDLITELDTASDPAPGAYPYGPFGAAQRDRTTNRPEAVRALIRAHADNAPQTG